MDERTTRRAALRGLGAAGALGLAGCLGGGGGDGGGGTDGGTNASSGGNGSGGSGSGGGTDTSTSGDDSGGDGSSGGSASGSLTIGVLQPLSGDLQYYGQQALWGFFSGLAHKGDTEPVPEATTGTKTATVGNVDYELVIRDTELSDDTAQTAATSLVQNDGVDMLFGITSSSAAERVISTVVAQAGIPIVVGPAASASITSSGDTCGPNVFRASENTAMDARSGGRYVAQETDVSSVYLFGADYSFGQAVVSNYRQVLESEGVEIAGERLVPQGYSEWGGLLQNAQSAGADGVVGGFTVATLPNFLTAILQGNYDFRVFGGFATQISTQVIGQLLAEQLGTPLTAEKLRNAQVGPFTTRYHWNQYDNPINDSFVDTYTNAYGVVPDLFSSGTFTAASAIVQAVEESGSTDVGGIADALSGMTVTDTPKGEGGYSFQSYNNQARSAMTIANPVPNEEQAWDAPIMPSSPLTTIPGEETTIPQDASEMNCSL
jgi:branched-chain amino acid transport system substrate-binding protein